MSRIRIFVEYGKDNIPVKRHEVTMPNVPEHDFYRQTVSFNAFTNFTGKLCANTGRLTFHYKDEYSIKMEEESRIRFFNRYGDKEGWIITSDLPSVSHASIWDFYKFIGYDRKKKKLVPPT